VTFAVVGIAAFAVSALTLFSGFGLGTLLMPVFALFFPVPVAVASTALVHAANNAFKVALLGRRAPREVVVRFGLPAVAAAFLGALALGALAGGEPLATWSLGPLRGEVTAVALVMGALILAFAVLELAPTFEHWRPSPRWLPLGGALSGFFGGLSGHQGALRAAFLSPLGLEPARFAATQAVLGFLVDAARLAIYGASFLRAGSGIEVHWTLVGFATACAFAGALLGRRLLPAVTVGFVRALTGGLLLVVGLALASGLA